MSSDWETFTLAAYLGCQGLWLWLQAPQDLDPSSLDQFRARGQEVPGPHAQTDSFLSQ